MVVDHVERASMIPHQSISEDRVTSSASAEPHMYGRDADKENIIKMLLQNVDNEHGLSVCPILGIGGLGKTTLAQFVCKDDRVKNHFHVQIWVCVSDHFNVKRLLKEIVEIVTKSRFDHDNLDVIRGAVVEQLRGKRFLLVLDDVWSDKQDVWNMLKDPLTTGAKGSSIIVTTRLKTVASITKTISEPYQLDGLSEDDCWSLFTFYAFEAGKESDNSNLVTIGKEIIKKCGRLPLAAKALGSMLRFKVEERQWREVRDNEIWDLEEEVGSDQCPKILPALRLSYNNLSARARQCFAYCCFFPKDYKMRKEELVYIWLANGLLEFKNKEPEDVGEDVFGELLLHSFFQDMEENEDGKIETVKIHDLMHDLASAVMKSEYLHIEVKVGMSIDSSIQDDEIRPRHVSIIVLSSSSELSSVDVSSIHRFLSSHQCHLRTFFLFLNEDKGMSDSCDVISVVSGLKNLRALLVESWNAEISTLLLSFGDKLKLLKYLNLRGCGLSSLHGESFRGMKNLQFLDLSQNGSLKTLPDSMGEYMGHLKHLNLGGCDLSSLHGESFRGMKNLQFLDLSGNKSLETLPDSMGEYMGHLKHLNFSGCGLSSLHAELFCGMKNLQILDLSQNMSLETLPNSMGQYMEHLKHLNLRSCYLLSLHGELFRGMKKLQFLDLSWNGRDMETIPDSVGNLEQLRHLNLSHNRGLKVLPESLGNLTKLETLKLNGCSKLVMLPRNTSKLCSLRQLENHGCWGLRGMPSGIGQGLSRLEKLSWWAWVWGSEESENIEELRGLSLLAGSLRMYIKEDDAAYQYHLHDAEEEVLTNKTNLSKLDIWFSPKSGIEFNGYDDGDDDVSSSNEQALRILKPPSNIESLSIHWYKGRRFPEWMEMRDPHSSSSFPRLRTIQLNTILKLEEWVLNWRHKEECLPALQYLEIYHCYGLKGLPKELGNLATLKSLYVYDCKELVSVPQLIYLEYLTIDYCSELVSMPQLELITSLKELTISDCPKLKFVFHGLRHLTSLQHLRINRSPGVVILKEELDPLVALRGPSFLEDIDEELIHDQYHHQEDSTTTSETRGKQVLQLPTRDDNARAVSD